ncbi:hypothetical protein ACIBH1_47990 [Nonomuraea sp. NPDC050663]|uniref:hypothetical protein n=1 Tax=Nonomuraea sp. NPDC050663 TaxID=3364370 RepID=UPI003799481F
MNRQEGWALVRLALPQASPAASAVMREWERGRRQSEASAWRYALADQAAEEMLAAAPQRREERWSPPVADEEPDPRTVALARARMRARLEKASRRPEPNPADRSE